MPPFLLVQKVNKKGFLVTKESKLLKFEGGWEECFMTKSCHTDNLGQNNWNQVKKSSKTGFQIRYINVTRR